MTPQEVYDYFGSQAATAKALGITKGAMTYWNSTGVPPLRQAQIEVLTNGKLKSATIEVIEPTMTIGDRIKAERDARGWSQQELARRAGVSQQLITRLETGKVNETKRIVQLAKVFGMPAEELHSQEPPPDSTPPTDLVHRVCDFLRHERDELNCNQCPLKVETQYGPGTVACVLRAQELINIVRGKLK